MKVFGIGFHKTGTSTLGQALSQLEFKVCGAKTALAKELSVHNFESVWHLVDQFNAFQDNPWPLLYKELDRKYPGSKFILTIREEDRWINSVVNHFGNDQTEMRTLIYGKGSPKGNEDQYLKTYRTHNQTVIEYFKDRPKDFLLLSWENGDGWGKLCPFLEKPIPQKPFPHSNKGSYTLHEKLLRLSKGRIKALLNYRNS